MDKYQEMTPERLVAMSSEERAEYYHQIYQYVGQLLTTVPDLRPQNIDPEGWKHFPKEESEIGWWVHGSVIGGIESLLDQLAGLVDHYSE